MKKLIAGIAIAAAACGCGNLGIIYNFTYDVALVKWPDGTMKEIQVKQWSPYGGREQVQVIGKDGAIYLISMNNAVLIQKAK